MSMLHKRVKERTDKPITVRYYFSFVCPTCGGARFTLTCSINPDEDTPLYTYVTCKGCGWGKSVKAFKE